MNNSVLKINMKSSLFFIWSLYVYLCVLLPSGSVYGFNIKLLVSLFLFLFSFSFYRIFYSGMGKSIFGFFCFILFFSIISVRNGYPLASVLSQFIGIISIIIPLWVGVNIVAKGGMSVYQAKNLIIRVAAVHAFIKIISFVIIYLGFLSLEEYLSFQKNIFGVVPISLEVSSFVRLNVPSDFIFPIATLLCFSYEQARLKRNIYMSMFFFAVVISYSRYLWLYAIISFISVFFISSVMCRNLIKTKKLISTLVVFFLACFFIVLYLYLNSENTIFSFIQERYTGVNSNASDVERVTMYNWLYNYISESPIFGYGLGSYMYEYIRFYNTPWNYELQWLSLLMNFGVFGVLYIVFQGVAFYWSGIVSLLKNKIYDKLIIWLMTVFLWLLVGFFNCFLITSSAGIIYFSFWVYIKMNDSNLFHRQSEISVFS